jgi:hypothetical protein
MTDQLIEQPTEVVDGEVTEVNAPPMQSQTQLAGALIDGAQIHRRSSSLEVAIAEAKAKAVADRFTAREYKRDLKEAWQDIEPACTDPDFAFKALSRREDAHELDASIRLLEHVAVNYGNLAYGVRMFHRDEQQSEVEVYSTDKQKGSDFSDSFIVLHERQSGQKVEKVWQPIKINDLVNAEISKRLRKGLKKMISPVILRRAVDLCKATCNKALEDVETRKKMLLEKFSEGLGVDKSQLQAYLKKAWDKVDRKDLQKLYATYTAIREGETKLTDAFPQAKGNKTPSEAPPMAIPQQNAQEDKPSKDEKKTKHKSQSATTTGSADTAQPISQPQETNQDQSTAQDAESISSSTETQEAQKAKPPIKPIKF